ncbi:MAG: nitrilase cyanide hydratase and apolipoprotein n-acyltransferase [Pseudomonas sp.]|nr:nitrilase cyanide hydratase and apolipoprotein n-acyltransferase [Pseudomonas sp.]
MGHRILAAAQSVSIAGDIDANIQRHLTFMRAAIEQGVEFLLFPELSLTGYERSLAHELAIKPSDSRLQPLQQLARDSGMITVVGAPIRLPGSDEVLIAALVLGTEPTPGIYTKQHLHPGEDLVFSPGTGGAGARIEDEHISLAVCADFSQAIHAQRAAESGATLYAASVLITGGGYVADSGLLAGYAAKHHMAVLMANHGGTTGGWESVGRSALWAEDGTLVGETQGAGNLLLLARREAQGWSAQSVPVIG